MRNLAGLLLALALCAAAVRADDGPPLERFESAPLPSSGEGLRYAIGFPAGWEIVLRGERTRAVPPAPPSRREPEVFLEVQGIARDEPGTERLLEEAGGLARWVAAVDRRRKLESTEKWRIGGKERDVLFFREAHGAEQADRRVIVVEVPANDVHLLLFAVAPAAEFKALAPLFKRVIESFEVRS